VAAAHATNVALAGAGCEVIEIPPRADRIPRWPGGYVGSIAHDTALAVAVAVSRSHALTVGIDVERHDALDPADAALVLTDDEQRFVDGDAVRATRVWCAKESAYKAWCTALAVELDHVDPRTIVVTQTAPFALRIEARDELAGRVASIGSLRGRWQRLDDLVIVLVWKLAADRG
jgi:4'-phosphopantetheinyl transferase EntD